MNPKRLLRCRCGGQSLIEFTFVGIPLIFVLISVFEISRGMWIYHTLAHAAKEGVRYASVHGFNCTQNGNTCAVNMGPVANKCDGTNTSVAEVIRCAAIGLDPTKTNISFYTFPAGSTVKTLQGSCTLATGSCSATQYPPDLANQTNVYHVEIDITTPFNSALAMLWPGAKPVSFTSGNLGATSADTVKF